MIYFAGKRQEMPRMHRHDTTKVVKRCELFGSLFCFFVKNPYFCNMKLRKECNLLEMSVG